MLDCVEHAASTTEAAARALLVAPLGMPLVSALPISRMG
jgi:hypothetical protein